MASAHAHGMIATHTYMTVSAASRTCRDKRYNTAAPTTAAPFAMMRAAAGPNRTIGSASIGLASAATPNGQFRLRSATHRRSGQRQTAPGDRARTHQRSGGGNL